MCLKAEKRGNEGGVFDAGRVGGRGVVSRCLRAEGKGLEMFVGSGRK